MKNTIENNKQENKWERFYYQDALRALSNLYEMYRTILSGTLIVTDETKKATQNSIRELCATLSEYVSVFENED